MPKGSQGSGWLCGYGWLGVYFREGEAMSLRWGAAPGAPSLRALHPRLEVGIGWPSREVCLLLANLAFLWDHLMENSSGQQRK